MRIPPRDVAYWAKGGSFSQTGTSRSIRAGHDMLHLNPIPAIELRHLRYFIALAEEGSVTRAAERLGIQQPPLSQQLRAMEDQLGTILFKRSSRGIKLTGAGEQLLEGARKILKLFEDTLEETRRFERGQTQRIVVGYTSSSAFNDLVPQAIRRFSQGFPEISVILEERCTTELIKGLQSGQIDVAFVRGLSDTVTDVSIFSLINERMVVAMPNSHRLCTPDGPATVPLEGLSGETFVMYRRSRHGLYNVIIDACARAGFVPRVGQEAPRMAGALTLVAAGFGIALVPIGMQRLDAKSISYIPLEDDATLKAPIQLAIRTNDPSPVAALFYDFVLKLPGTVVHTEQLSMDTRR